MKHQNIVFFVGIICIAIISVTKLYGKGSKYLFCNVLMRNSISKRGVELESKGLKTHRNITHKNINYNYNGERFVIHGKWIPGKHHNKTCDFIPKRACCKRDLDFHFEFYNEMKGAGKALRI